MTPAEHYKEAIRLLGESERVTKDAHRQRAEIDVLNPVDNARLRGTINRAEQLQRKAQTHALLSIAAAGLPLTVLIDNDDTAED
ncbi:hypothetical protein SEA_LOZINAK_99 [Gordonia phage Lozinak]|uniref:Uncharacterized protein n=3 Tax=Smoothievirus TaxID=1982557 RepID=A0A2D1GFV4_9CAUD|nr:hypothetical protein BEN60_gp107 [Gordonia phage Smoothie]YP_009276212.1 hypothetical protein BH772_gp110 [Gordonia phage Bachita]YP_009281254.1 hypothetical protein BIZ74_gp105 [Gordonia phage Cucurbita]ATN90725.1 hypothetical protein SEA_LOZINAK_99 [Gordonia phage Lozinak]AUE23608.1 hypothetical protein SEA_TONIANN_101 [Gordonia phage Toniann]QKY79676.1 hypothetical protein SEA_ENGINEER_100 [Gordonia Phage Engineer]WKW85897.1 hypothetical protein SEA_PHINKBODEN_98 [Gordonia Phage PhinkBo